MTLARVLAMSAAVGVMFFAGILPVHSEAPPPLVLPGCAVNAASAASRPMADAIPIADPAVPAPAISAKSAVVIDADTGRVLYDLNAHQRRAPASTTKIMTAILTIENGNFDKVITSDIDATKMTGSSVMGLRPGVQISERDLIFGLMLPSGNDAAIELAKAIDGSVPAFVDRMNAKAAELGLADTHFMNPHGLDARGHYSTAYDLAMLARYGMKNPTFVGLVGTEDWTLSPPSEYELHNGNSLLERYPGADGVKIGWTESAGWTFVASASRDGHRLIVALMDTQDRDADATALLDWGWASHRWAPVDAGAGQVLLLASKLGFNVPLLRAIESCS
jgi:D-alanyl-D-alanine carboxypeptidase (penicillin-binding protein 5/6)